MAGPQWGFGKFLGIEIIHGIVIFSPVRICQEVMTLLYMVQQDFRPKHATKSTQKCSAGHRSDDGHLSLEI